jgi:hypothetical protein
MAPGLNQTSSSLPDLRLYEKWDARTTLKVRPQVNFISFPLPAGVVLVMLVVILTSSVGDDEIKRFQDHSQEQEKSTSGRKDLKPSAGS